MALSKECLSAIQKAGSATYVADAMLKEVVKAYADSVRDSVSQSPFDRSTDGLFEAWKTIARLSASLEQVESEIRKIFEAAKRLDPVGSFSRPIKGTSHMEGSSGARDLSRSDSTSLVKPIEATEVFVQVPRKSKKTAAAPRSKSAEKIEKGKLSPNTLKLFNHLRTVLNTKTYTNIKRSVIGVNAGLPLGSVGASFSKLLSADYLLEDTKGGLLLVLKK